MSINAALNSFLGKNGAPRLNCAQAILKTFQKEFGVEAAELEKFAAYGGGNAPDGLCGAFYAVKYLGEQQPGWFELASFENSFREEAGSLQCREIKAAKKLSCADCVTKCAAFLAEHRLPS
jgi:hypothetical protein